MDLCFDTALAEEYRSSTQITRVLTESWVANNIFCPRCGCPHIRHFENNRPVADFFCPCCGSEFELKSKNGKLGKKITDGAYEMMIRRVSADNNPDFFFLSYSKAENKVKDLIFVPKHFFWEGIIEKRKPLADTARRAGWVGCNILLGQIPNQGRIPIVENEKISDKTTVIQRVTIGERLKIENIQNRGWLFDVLMCVNNIRNDVFLLNDVYAYEPFLSARHPNNLNVRPKIRQQLQILRNKGFLVFMGDGHYRKIKAAGILPK